MPKSRRLLSLYILNQSLHWFILGVTLPVTALLLLEKGLDLFQLGVMLAVYSGTVVVELPTGGLADAVGRKKVYLLSQAARVCSALVLLVSRNLVGVLGASSLAYLLLPGALRRSSEQPR